VSGPKSCKEKIALSQVPSQFRAMVSTRQGRKILGILGPEENPAAGTSFSIDVDSRIFTVSHGTILVAAIASWCGIYISYQTQFFQFCTNL
jgi:hypothetical protein